MTRRAAVVALDSRKTAYRNAVRASGRRCSLALFAPLFDEFEQRVNVVLDDHPFDA
jgi:hypothetical protein